jgi:hypothetical protein
MAAPGSRRDAAKAVKTADAVIASMRSAGEAATATTLAAITQVLKANTPLMYHIHALLQNDEWRAVLEASAFGVDEEVDFEDAKKATPLRATIKKIDHLKQTLHQDNHQANVVKIWKRMRIEAMNT